MGRWDCIEVVQQRYAQLVHGCEPELHLGLGRSYADHTAAGRPSRHVLEQRCLAHTGLAVHDQCPADAPADIVEELVQYTSLRVAADEVRCVPADRGGRWLLHPAKARSQPGFQPGGPPNDFDIAFQPGRLDSRSPRQPAHVVLDYLPVHVARGTDTAKGSLPAVLGHTRCN